MKVLVIGGAGFVSRAVIDRLGRSHRIEIATRGACSAERVCDPQLDEVRQLRSQIARFAPDILLDMSPRNGPDAEAVIAALDGRGLRLVCISSGSVYRTFGRLVGTEAGPIENAPQPESACLRSMLFPYARASPKLPDDPRAWLNDYDKIPVERAYLAAASLAVSIVRLPLIYGPGDADGRVARYQSRMRDPASAIPLHEDALAWRNSRCALANAVEAVALVVEGGAAGAVYNVAEPDDLAEADWIAQIGAMLSWRGRVEPVAKTEAAGLPVDDLPLNADFRQHLRLDSSKIRRDLDYREVQDRPAALRAALGLDQP